MEGLNDTFIKWSGINGTKETLKDYLYLIQRLSDQ